MGFVWLAVLLLFMTLLQSTISLSPPPCVPTNWNYAWSFAGNVWFTRTRDKGEWYTMAEKCANIDPGRSSMASIRSAEEQKNVITDLPDENWWIGGVRLGGNKWYWAAMMKDRVRVASMTYKYWDEGEPNNHGNEYCMHMYDEAVQRRWNDINCFGNHFRAICEIRCDDGRRLPSVIKNTIREGVGKEEETDGQRDFNYNSRNYNGDDDNTIRGHEHDDRKKKRKKRLFKI